MSWTAFVLIVCAAALVCLVVSLGIWMQSHLDRSQVDYIKQLRQERREAKRRLEEEFAQEREMSRPGGL
jgi:predicted Holliday junction resolvase-like endonuclease